jgi:hypothetical protein
LPARTIRTISGRAANPIVRLLYMHDGYPSTSQFRFSLSFPPE